MGGTRESSREAVGVRLKRLRLARGLSQRELSAPGVSYAYISRIEAGERTPSVKALRMLAKKLGVSEEYLETGHDLREGDERELRLLDAELELRLSDETHRAERRLASILAEATASGDAAAALRARIGLGVAAAERGRYLEAVERLEQVVEDEAPSSRTYPELYTALGRSHAAVGKPERAVSLFERCLEEVESDNPADVLHRVRYATLLSYALLDAGEARRASDVVRGALAGAEDVADPYAQVRLYWSAARLDLLEQRPAAALANIRNAIALLKTTDDTTMLARAHLLASGAGLPRVDVPASRNP